MKNKEEILRILDVACTQAYNWRRSMDPSIGTSMETFNLVGDTILRLAPKSSTYYAVAMGCMDSLEIEKTTVNRLTYTLCGTVNALQTAYKNDTLIEIEETIRADTFGDFLEMAEHLMNEYKDGKNPAAVLIGSVLEQHLRKLCLKNDLSIMKENKNEYRKAEDLNQDLYSIKKIYNKSIMQMVTTNLTVRNYAAHGEYEQFTKTQVESMLRDTRTILCMYPA